MYYGFLYSDESDVLCFGIRMNSMMTEFWMNLMFYCPCMGVNLDLGFPNFLSLRDYRWKLANLARMWHRPNVFTVHCP